LVAILVQGCNNRSKPADDLAALPAETNSFAADTNVPPMETSNMATTLPSVTTSNPPPVATPLPPVDTAPPVPAATASEYAVLKGDSLAKIAKTHGVSLKALEAANPTVQPTKLKVGQKLVIPVGGKAAVDAAAPGAAPLLAGESTIITYIVKAGDNLTKIAKTHGVSVKAIQAANGLATTQIVVGKKLKIPTKVEKAAVSSVVMPPAVESLPTVPQVPTAPPAIPTNH
jgi:LysM repeat protein